MHQELPSLNKFRSSKRFNALYFSEVWSAMEQVRVKLSCTGTCIKVSETLIDFPGELSRLRKLSRSNQKIFIVFELLSNPSSVLFRFVG